MKLLRQSLSSGLGFMVLLALVGCEDPATSAFTDKRPSNIDNYSEQRSFPRVWDDLVEARETHVPNKTFCLNPSATPDQLREVQRQLGQTFPEDVRELYLYADGQRQGEDCLPLFGKGYWFLPLEEMMARWQMRLEEHQGSMSAESMYGRQGAVYGYEWHPAWIPLAARSRDQELALDFVPTPMGASGQIIGYAEGETDRDHMAMSLTAYLGQLEREILQLERFPSVRGGDAGE